MKTIAISGASGFVGSHLVRHYHSLGYDVLALGRQNMPPDKLNRFARWQTMDLSKPISPIKADVLVHSAGLVDDQSSFNKLWTINCKGSENIFDAFQGEHVVYISSSSVYNNQSNAIHEDSDIDFSRLSDYGKSKLLSEQALRDKAISRSTRLTILRPRAIYGTQDRVLLPKILNLCTGHRLRSIGDMNIDVSMTNINNLIAAVDASIDEENQALIEVYNVADDPIYKLRNVILTTISHILKQDPIVLSIPVMLARTIQWLTKVYPGRTSLTRQAIDYMSKSCVLDTYKIKQNLAYKPSFTFSEEIIAISEWVDQVGLDVVRHGDKRLPWMI